MYALLAAALTLAPSAVLTKKPELVQFVEAEYPAEEKARGVEAKVLLSINLLADGTVDEVSILRSAGPNFDAAALAAVKNFVFTPAEVDGEPAPVKIVYEYAFTIKTEVVKLGPQINFEGTILERFKKTPLAGVRVTIAGTDTSTLTGAGGRFSFLDLAPGTIQVEVSGDQLITVSTDETIAPGQKTSVTYLVEKKEEDIDEEEVLRASRIKKESTQIAIRTEEARRVPGTQGDTLKIIQNLPGVARSAIGSGQLIVWGASAKDTRVLVDGVEIPALYHLGGLRSTLSSDLVAKIDLLPGAYGAEYGRGLGAIVRVETKPLPKEGFHGFVAADVLDASMMLSHAFGDRLRVGVAARYGYLDRLLRGVVASDIGDIFPIPQYSDYQLKAQLSLREDETLTLLLLGADDHLRRAITSSDPTLVRSENIDSRFYHASITYEHLQPDGSSFSVTPSVVWDSTDRTSIFGVVPAELAIESLRYGLRGSYRRKLAPFATFSAGVDALGVRSEVSRSGSINVPAREGDIFLFGQPPGDDVNFDDWSAELVDIAPFASLELRLGPLELVPGVRVDAMIIEGSRLSPRVGTTPGIGFSRLELTADPRIAARIALTERLSLGAAAGIYHQAPEPEDLSAVFGTPSLGTSRAYHFTASAGFAITETLHLEVTGFYKELDRLVVRSRLPTPELARALSQDGEGNTYGVQLLLRQELASGFFGWVSYTLSESMRRDAPDAPERYFDFDQTHSLALVASYELERWVFGARLRFATGMPRTPVVGAFSDLRGDQFQPIFGAQNSIRIPEFFQLDLRVERSFLLSDMELRVYVDFQNVTLRENPEEIIYTADFSRQKLITGLPFLAVLGARLEF